MVCLLLAGNLVWLACTLSGIPTLDAPATNVPSQNPTQLQKSTAEALINNKSATPSSTLPVPSPSPTASPSLLAETSTTTPTPTLSPVTIGYSVEGRPLEVWRFGWGGRHRMIVAGIHGGYEWNTVALADELIIYLKDHQEEIPVEKSLFILRNLNPDGEAADHGPDGRANANGVDLNRNFPGTWERDWPRSGCWQLRPISAGTSPASEPETQALIYFIQSHPIDALISYHSAGLGIFPAGITPNATSASLAQTLSAVSGYQYPPVDTGCVYTGMLANWAASLGLAAVDLELSTHGDTEFQVNLAVLSAFLNWEP